MFEFHKDKERYFNYQYLTSRDYIMPFVRNDVTLDSTLDVLEIGSAEAGVLKAFLERGHRCVGIELSSNRVETAKQLLADELNKGRVRFLAKNIHDIDLEKDIGNAFDLVILKDVIEHIHDRPDFMEKLHAFLKPGGKVFFGFPPWQMPYGGHQQICDRALTSKMPYYHLLPTGLYKTILKSAGETESTINHLLEIKETGISLERFERLVKSSGFRIIKKRLYLINPIYKFKFGLKPRRQSGLIGSIPIVRNFLTSAGYYLIEAV